MKAPGDVTTFVPDPAMPGKYLALVKFVSVDPVAGVEPKNILRSRAFKFVDKLDAPFDLNALTRVALLPAGADVNGDIKWDEYYGSSAWHYGSHWIGGLKVWHGGGNYHYSMGGCAFLKFASSHDGIHWRKALYLNDAGVPEVFLANGQEGGNGGKNDGGYMTEFSNPPLRIGDELILYYGSTSWGKNHPSNVRVSGGGVFRARLRPDGFVSVDSGTLTTTPLRLAEGSALSVNAVGPVDVEVIDANGKSLGRASLAGDSLRHEAKFPAGASSALATGAGARLRFTVKPGGRLYSFTGR
jgi:hypothetical protein